jgi:hypothetical protein
LKIRLFIVDFPIKNGGSFHSYFDITRGYHEAKELFSSALLDLAILDSVEAAGILEFSLLWMLGRNPKQGWQLNLGNLGGRLSCWKSCIPSGNLLRGY